MVNFGKALEEVKAGKKISRAGWNGANQFVCRIENIANTAPELVNGFKNAPYLVIKNAQNLVFPWTPSQGDLFAEDWVIHE